MQLYENCAKSEQKIIEILGPVYVKYHLNFTLKFNIQNKCSTCLSKVLKSRIFDTWIAQTWRLKIQDVIFGPTSVPFFENFSWNQWFVCFTLHLAWKQKFLKNERLREFWPGWLRSNIFCPRCNWPGFVSLMTHEVETNEAEKS